MNFDMELIHEIFELCILPLLGVLTKFLIDFLNAKRAEAYAKADSETEKKYINMIHNTITECVIATNQTYVDNLKKAGSFDKAAQEEAFSRTLNTVLAILTDDTKEYLQEVTNDTNAYLSQVIEAKVKVNH